MLVVDGVGGWWDWWLDCKGIGWYYRSKQWKGSCVAAVKFFLFGLHSTGHCLLLQTL